MDEDADADAKVENAKVERFKRIQRDITNERISLEDLRFLNNVILDYESAISWGTTCTNCANVLDHCYTETVARERAEVALTSVRAQLVEARQPQPMFRTDFNVRRDGNRLTAYIDDESAVPHVGDTVIVGVLEGPVGREKGNTAVLARVHAVRKIPAPNMPADTSQTHLPPKQSWAIEVDWQREHDW